MDKIAIMTKNKDWRIPNDEEKELALYWIKRNRNGNVSFPIACFAVISIGIIAFAVASYLFEPDNLTKAWPMFIILGFFLCIIGWFCIYNMITEIEKVRMVSKGDFQIIDAKVQYVGKKRMARYSYMDVVEASYHSGFGAKPTTFSVSRSVKKRTEAGDVGYVIRFPNGKNRNCNAIVFIPNSMEF